MLVRLGLNFSNFINAETICVWFALVLFTYYEFAYIYIKVYVYNRSYLKNGVILKCLISIHICGKLNKIYSANSFVRDTNLLIHHSDACQYSTYFECYLNEFKFYSPRRAKPPHFVKTHINLINSTY